MEKNVVVFAPHPDDETLGCGGTIAKNLSEGHDVHIVFMTDGRYALRELGIVSGPAPCKIKEIRKEEAIKATRILGLQEKNLTFLDFEDKTLRKQEKPAQERITTILDDCSPEEVYFPQKREYNIDHRMTNRIVRRAIEASNLHPIEYQYIIAWAFPFYLLAHVVNGQTLDLFMSKLQKGTLIHLNISQSLLLKKMAIMEYKSQTALLFNGQKRPPLKNTFLNRFLEETEKFFVDSQHKNTLIS